MYKAKIPTQVEVDEDLLLGVMNSLQSYHYDLNEKLYDDLTPKGKEVFLRTKQTLEQQIRALRMELGFGCSLCGGWIKDGYEACSDCHQRGRDVFTISSIR